MEYTIIKNFLPVELCQRMADFMWEKQEQNSFYFDNQCAISPAFMKLFTHPAKVYKEKLETELVKKLYYTYDHGRIYKKGEILTPHKDKNQCEVALSITLGYSGDNTWPIYLYSHEQHKIIEVTLDIGDALVYNGYELLHWRNQLTEDWQCQVFWFYASDDRFQDKLFPGIEDMITQYEFMV
jgi:hypothetical protein